MMSPKNISNNVRYIIAAVLIITLALAVMAYSSSAVITAQKESTALAVNAEAGRWEALAQYYAAQSERVRMSQAASDVNSVDRLESLRLHRKGVVEAFSGRWEAQAQYYFAQTRQNANSIVIDAMRFRIYQGGAASKSLRYGPPGK